MGKSNFNTSDLYQHLLMHVRYFFMENEVTIRLEGSVVYVSSVSPLNEVNSRLLFRRVTAAAIECAAEYELEGNTFKVSL